MSGGQGGREGAELCPYTTPARRDPPGPVRAARPPSAGTGLPSPGEGREGHPSPGLARREVPGINHCAPLPARQLRACFWGVSGEGLPKLGEKRRFGTRWRGGLVFPAGIFAPAQGTRVAAAAVPRCPLAPWVLAEAEAGMAAGAGGSIVPGRLLCVLESELGRLALRGPGTRGTRGTRGAVCAGDAEQQVPLAPGPAPTVSCARPSLPQKFFFFFWAGRV